MSLIGKLFGTEKALNTAVEGVVNTIDKLYTTDEERAEARINAGHMITNWISSSQGQNLARRVLALSIASVWLLQMLAEKVVETIAIFSPSAELVKLEDALASGARDMNAPVMLILTFYFAAPHVGNVVDAVSKNFLAKKVDK